MSVMDRISELALKSAQPTLIPVPKAVSERIERGHRVLKEDAYKRRLCQLFVRGEAYAFINNQNQLSFLQTSPGVRSGKPKHRVRNRYNFIRPMVDAKVSSSTTRVPGYEVTPNSTAPESAAAAHLSEKILRMGYEKWYLRETRVKGASLAIGGGGSAFALPYFDPAVGPFHEVSDPTTGVKTWVGEGEIKVLLLNGNEVMWEPGVDFYHSRWYAVRNARPISEVKNLNGFLGMKLTADARISDIPTDAPTTDMVMVTLYFERPCAQWPEGRLLTIANGQQVVPEETYPMRRGGVVLDEPCIHRLVYRLDPDNDRDLGLTWELIDFQRTLNDTYNKIIELKNRALNLRMMAPTGSLKRAPTDEPGGIDYYDPVGGMKPEWERGPDPGIIGQLMNILSRVLDDMRYVAADVDVSAAPNVALGSIQQVIQQAGNRWSSFLGDLARWDSNIARHCLMLCQEHYTEERLLSVRGRFGWEPIQSFTGADIMDQIDVTVNPATIESHSRQAILAQLGWVQANFPGYVRPEVAIEIAMNGSSPESIIDGFEFQKMRINSIIQKIRDGSIMDMPSREEMQPGGPPDPVTGAPTQILAKTPGWMPRKFDNTEVQMAVYENWLQTDDFNRLPEHLVEVAMLVYEGFKSLEAQQQAQAQAAVAMQAEQLGAQNASKPQPQEAKPMPSTPNPGGPT